MVVAKVRVILHVDMNSFFASVEQAENPKLKGKPIAVAGNPRERRGVVVTCSYEARALGVYTTMNVGEARRLAPELIVIQTRHALYRQYSEKIFELLRQFTPLVEPVSIDEAYMDITDIGGLTHAVEIAESIQRRLLEELDLPCSIGIAPNKFLAKTASDLKKPLGISILRKRDVPKVLWPLPVIEMYGVGESTEQKLHALDIQTIGDLAQASLPLVKGNLGKHGERLHARANGEDSRIVDPEAAEDRKSVGSSTTLPADETDSNELYRTLGKLSEKVSRRLKELQKVGYTLTVQIKYANWKQQSRSRTYSVPLVESDDLTQKSDQLLQQLWNGQPVRLLGVTVSELVEQNEIVEQLTFDTYERYEKENETLRVLHQLQQKFGRDVISKGKKES